MADSSFDIVSKIDKQEVANAVNQAAKEIGSRYDFKNVGASVELSGESIVMKANSEERTLAVLDVLLVLLTLDADDIVAAGLEVRVEPALPGAVGSEKFPHVYGGPLPTSCVSNVEAIGQPPAA